MVTIKKNNISQEIISKRNPKIVVLGGGTGLSNLLRGLKKLSFDITAIVSMADDGGSSGRLRNQLGMLPPGDIRSCMVALAEKEALMEELFTYRFNEGDELKGHSLGNLMIAALADIYGSFEIAVRQLSRVLALEGKVVPSTLENVSLRAHLNDGTIIDGESNIPKAQSPIKRIEIKPKNPTPFQEALDSLNEADVIVLGPGSLYTSIIPNLLIADMAKTIKNSRAIKMHVCNVMTQQGETTGYNVSQHIRAIEEHSYPGIVDYVLVNNQIIQDKNLLLKYKSEGSEPVKVDYDEIAKMKVKVVAKPLIDESFLVRHNPWSLGMAIMELFMQHDKVKFK
ncbi:conserved hypothetical protein, cofD-related [Desulfonispora thiosulfatigenes DSM 11270]|uniref:Putative gluconeogenesis factor n=1 Tax=Desulfonispora thiosulfatigenes DSM 11270 TaxID=656914 RepID=A0A1W1UWK2_DESTI|nr:gluconeogenesis factor YvcK family protein [Desulfonispora thiosulfatigenes]SMB85473.1 conserved hypothetical protein, cofD-related [Desulfonispora thiosulfatigenes DSM 11270]